MSRIGFHLLHLFWMLASPSYRRFNRLHKVVHHANKRRTLRICPRTAPTRANRPSTSVIHK